MAQNLGSGPMTKESAGPIYHTPYYSEASWKKYWNGQINK